MIWTILGISVAVLAVFSISVAEMLVGKPIFENNREYIAGALAAAGVAAFLVGRAIEGRRETPEGEEGSRRFLLFDLRYWGPILIAFGVITIFIRPLKQSKVEQIYAAVKDVPKKILPQPEPEIPASNAPVVFPDLKMQGVIFRQQRPFAIINGNSYTVGDRLGDVVVRAIERNSVLLELEGEVRQLTLN